MEHSNGNIGDSQFSEEIEKQYSFTRKMLIAVIVLIVFIGGAVYLSASTSETRIMAPGPLGSTDSITQPLA